MTPEQLRAFGQLCLRMRCVPDVELAGELIRLRFEDRIFEIHRCGRIDSRSA